MKRIVVLFFLVVAFSCSKDEQKVVIDDFFFFKSSFNGSSYQTNGYMYADNSGHNGPQIWIRKTQGDSMYINASVEVISLTSEPIQVGNISAYFSLVKKNGNIEGSYILDKANYSDNYLSPIGSNLVYIDTTAAFNFVVSDSSLHLPHGSYADGAYSFTILQNGTKFPVTGNFRLKIPL
jgi:hypothetical protein